MKLYFSMHGSDEGGYRLMVYQLQPNGSATVYWKEPKEFDNLIDLADELDNLRNME